MGRRRQLEADIFESKIERYPGEGQCPDQFAILRLEPDGHFARQGPQQSGRQEKPKAGQGQRGYLLNGAAGDGEREPPNQYAK